MVVLEGTRPIFSNWAIHETLSSLYGGVGGDSQYLGYQVGSPEAGSPKIHIYLMEGADTLAAQSVLAAHGVLAINADKTGILANNSDTALITADDPLLGSDNTVSYTVWVDGELYTATSNTPLSGNQAQLSLTTEVPGEYLIEIKRQGAGKYESGYITINAQEVS